MKASILCGAHYDGPEAFGHPAPVSPTLCDPEVAQRSFDQWLEYAALADELGFDWVSVSEHHSSPLILTPSVAPIAGALTQLVKRARIALLGPLAPITNPIRTAEEIAVLDHLSHGRLIVLPLRGTAPEANAYGPRDPSTTQAITQEATLLIRRALTEPDTFAWQGEHFQFQKVAVWPRPVQQPPPLYFSGNSPASAQFAARERLGLCMSFHRSEVVAQTVAAYQQAAGDAGWQPSLEQIVYRGFVLVADTDERAADLEQRFVPPSMRYLLHGPGPQFAQQGNGGTHDGFGVGRMLFAGAPDTVVERIKAFHEATGVGVLDLIFASGHTPAEDVRRSIELFGREVLPRMRGIGEPVGAVKAREVSA